MNGSIFWLIVIVAACILFPVAGAVWRQIDYRRQVTGKKRMRTLKDGVEIYPCEGEMDPKLEALAHEAGMKRTENAIAGMTLR